ncbi:glutathione S-transferase family protein [Falsirhodobacter halotolerans]|uniref:glutathione S-transferase family protein n=1 Tax=Falsirhodobacter halotolerans TaxID=1146892 RepID=UPI001FD5E2BD|nr:glutathione S-transferase family protein [Falsirhodobacter halotolerans]MCJ8138879.1 glutathione S-transferase family protein [Falsirhodobacter halotolerans]
MLTIYGVYRSRATRPLWLLREIGGTFNHVPVIQAYRLGAPHDADAPFNTQSEEFLTLNPLGQIPVMEEDGLILTESLAITQHIAQVRGGDLGGRTPAEVALICQWSLLAATGIESPALEIQTVLEQGGTEMAEAQGALAISAQKLRRPFARLERHLATHDWLVGDRFTVADINVAECTRYGQGHPTLLAEYPAVGAWLARCQARPAFQDMMAARAAEPA